MLTKLYTLIGALAGRGIAIAGALLLALAIGRVAGAAELGTFALCQTTLNIISVIGRRGYDRTLTRYVGGLPSYEILNRKSNIRKTMAHILFSNILLAGIVYSAAWAILRSTIYFKIIEILPVFCFLIPIYSLTMVLSGYFRGIKEPGISALMESGSASFGAACIICGLYFYGFPVNLFNISLIFGLSSCFTLLLGLILFQISFRNAIYSDLESNSNLKNIDFKLESSFPFMLITLVPFINQFVPLFASGTILSPTEAGLFRVSERATLILSSPLLILSSILPPHILFLYRTHNLSKIRLLNFKISCWTASLGGVILLFCIFFRTQIVSIFGNEFQYAGDTFAIMAFGQYINLSIGPISLTLMMINQENIVRNVNILMVIIGIIMYPLSFFFGGALGGALVYSLILIIQGLIFSSILIKLTRL